MIIKRIKNAEIPMIGLRIIKSAVAVFLCFVIYFLRGNQGLPFYSAIAAILCLQPYRGSSWEAAKTRSMGTFIGGAWGVVFLLVEGLIHVGPTDGMLHYLVISIFIIPVIYTTVLLKKQNVSYFTCVVFLSIVVLHTVDSNPALFVFNRIMDTMIGIFVALLVNEFRIPKKKARSILFVSGIDEVLLNRKEKISNFGKVELNRMIEDGAKFTIATERTLASLVEVTSDLRLKLPVIAFDGAVMYSFAEKRYMDKKIIRKEQVRIIQEYFKQAQITCFVTALIENTMIIFYDELYSETEKDLYERKHKSLYRNYVKMDVLNEAETIYIMGIGKTEQINLLYRGLKNAEVTGNKDISTDSTDSLSGDDRPDVFQSSDSQSGDSQSGDSHPVDFKLSDSVRIQRILSREYENTTMIRIYDRDANKQKMIEKLAADLLAEEIHTFGNVRGNYTHSVKECDPDEMVRQIRNLYEPGNLIGLREKSIK